MQNIYNRQYTIKWNNTSFKSSYRVTPPSSHVLLMLLFYNVRLEKFTSSTSRHRWRKLCVLVQKRFYNRLTNPFVRKSPLTESLSTLP